MSTRDTVDRIYTGVLYIYTREERAMFYVLTLLWISMALHNCNKKITRKTFGNKVHMKFSVAKF